MPGTILAADNARTKKSIVTAIKKANSKTVGGGGNESIPSRGSNT